jgi:hypothetical protein
VTSEGVNKGSHGLELFKWGGWDDLWKRAFPNFTSYDLGKCYDQKISSEKSSLTNVMLLDFRSLMRWAARPSHLMGVGRCFLIDTASTLSILMRQKLLFAKCNVESTRHAASLTGYRKQKPVSN